MPFPRTLGPGNPLQRTRKTPPTVASSSHLPPSPPHSSDTEQAANNSLQPSPIDRASYPQVIGDISTLVQLVKDHLLHLPWQTQSLQIQCTPAIFEKFSSIVTFCSTASSLSRTRTTAQTHGGNPVATCSGEPLRSVYRHIDQLRYTYSSRKQLLRINPMPTEIHNCIQSIVNHTIAKWYKQDLLTDEEFEMLQVSSGTRVKIPGVGTKEPDLAIKYGDGCGFPDIVWEVGFSQSYLDLVQDARDWIIGTEGTTKMCVLVKIAEDQSGIDRKARLGLHWSEFMVKRRDIEVDNGEAVENASPDDGNETPPDSPTSDVASYKDIRNSIKVSEWVGDLTVFMEAWIIDPANPENITLAHPRLEILPLPGDGHPALVLSREHFGLPGGEKLVVDLAKYASALERGRLSLATERFMHWRGERNGKRKAESEEKEWNPEESDRSVRKKQARRN